ncbi:unnamed protein product, partial [Choristocarpus tenellus]
RHFEGDPLNPEAGERFWKDVLIHGGAKDPHNMMNKMLGSDSGS